MSLHVLPVAARPRIAAEERDRVRAIAAPVAHAARILLKDRRSHLSKADLEALGMLAVWRQLSTYDPERGPFDRWVFYRALRSMIDASRAERREIAFEVGVRRGALAYVAQDDRPAQHDFHNDTPETDLGRLRVRTQRLGASAWLESLFEGTHHEAPIERTVAAADAVRSVHEEIAQLSEEQRTYLHLRFWDDTEVLEVAERMGLSERTLRRRWAQTRDLLANRLRARGICGVPDGFSEAVDALAWDEEPNR